MNVLDLLTIIIILNFGDNTLILENYCAVEGINFQISKCWKNVYKRVRVRGLPCSLWEVIDLNSQPTKSSRADKEPPSAGGVGAERERVCFFTFQWFGCVDCAWEKQENEDRKRDGC